MSRRELLVCWWNKLWRKKHARRVVSACLIPLSDRNEGWSFLFLLNVAALARRYCRSGIKHKQDELLTNGNQ